MSLADDANLLLIPTGYKAEKLYSIFPTSGVGDFDFARTTSATRVAKNGFITTVGANVPRLNYDILDGEVVGCPHLLLEPVRLNSIPYSQEFSNSDWTKSNTTITSNVVISPDGTLNASKITENSASGTHRISDTIIVSGTGVIYTQSIFAKSGGNGRYLRIFRGSGTYNNAVFDLENGTVVTQSGSNIINTKIENYGNGWYRCISTYTTQFGNIATYYGLQNGSTDSYQGDGTSGIYIWGAMLEEGSFATSYIKSNSGSATTRAAETCNGSGDAATFNDSEGVLMAEISALTDLGSYRLISLSDGTTSQAVRILYNITDNQIYGQCVVGGSTVAFIPFVPTSISNINKIAFLYKQNDFQLWVNGFQVGTDTSGSIPTGLNDLSFDRGDGVNPFYGKTKQIQYHSTALSDSNLEKLTSWTSFNEMANGQLYTIE